MKSITVTYIVFYYRCSSNRLQQTLCIFRVLIVCVFLVIIPEMANSAYGIPAANRFLWEVILRLVLC